jgi:2,4-dienoyl-CoA reductase (NADPH2)
MMLFNEIKIREVMLKNRIVMSAMNMGYSDDGTINERIINFCNQRARGGAGLIFIGGTAINSGTATRGLISLHDDTFIASHQRLTSTLKGSGASVGCQLLHPGRYSFGFLSGLEVVAPSAIPSTLTGYMPRALSTEEVYKVINDFVLAGKRAQLAGYDLVEIVMSAGYLVSQFLSPLTNKRTDEFGGSPENRRKFGLEIVKAMRKEIGNMPISVRLGGKDFMPGGNSWEELSCFAAELEKAGADIINVTGGWHESYIPQVQAEVPRGTYSYLAAKIKQSVNIPVVSSNRINSPEVAERILQAGQADLITIARGFLADPEWGNKALQGKSDTIRRCIGCMTCLSCLFKREGSVACAINPQAGRETETVISKTDAGKKVLIIGAGPAGLEAARTAALRGHQVIIWEQADRIGGQWNIAAVPPGKTEYLSLLEYYRSQIRELNIDLRLNYEATPDRIKAETADIILVAAGATPRVSTIQAAADARIIEAWDVLAGQDVAGKEIVVAGGGSVGCETALYLAEKGTLDAEALKFLLLHKAETPDELYKMITRGTYHISVIEMGPRLADDLPGSIRWTVSKHMKTMGITTYASSTVTEITSGKVIIEDVQGIKKELPADTVVMAVGSKANNSLYEAIKGLYPQVYLLGDAQNPSKVMDAIHNAFDLVNKI